MVGQTFPKKTINDVPIGGKTVLVRADYNVPLNSMGEITDDFRIVASLPTIQKLLDLGCKVIIASHLGRPDGKPDEKYSLRPVADRLTELLHSSVAMANDCVGDAVRLAAKKLEKSQVLLLENVRFYAEEEENSENFAKRLAEDTGAEYFVQDGFGVVHRAHASTDAITHFVPSVAGELLKIEWMALTSVMRNPEEPVLAVLGGAKVSDKIKIIEKFIDIADHIYIGGAMANNFLKFKGLEVGKSLTEDGVHEIIEKIYAQAALKVGADQVDDFIVLPRDVAVTDKDPSQARRMIVGAKDIIDDDAIYDIGFESISDLQSLVDESKTVIWNGTLGYAEATPFAHGSARLALAIATKAGGMTSVIGGGDTADFVRHWDAETGGSFSHVSTGGGASLDLLSGKKLPGIEALLDA